MSSAAGSFIGGVTSLKEGQETQKILRRQAAYTREKAQQEIADITTKEGEQLTDITDALHSALSTQKAQYGAAGVKSEGSPMEVLLDTQVQAKQAYNRTVYWAERAKADIHRWSSVNAGELEHAGKMAKKAGRMAFYGGMTQGTIQTIASIASYGMAAGGGGSSPKAGNIQFSPAGGGTFGANRFSFGGSDSSFNSGYGSGSRFSFLGE